MPTILSHPAVPLALHVGLGQRVVSSRLLAVSVVCSILPDLDVLAFQMGIPYSSYLGHRGFTHSIFFALVIAVICTAFYQQLHTSSRAAFSVSFLSGVSHGFLDAFTNGGLGVAFLWPISDQRFFFPVQVIEVSPIGLSRFLSSYAWHVLYSEIIWIWLPCAIVGSLAYAFRTTSGRSKALSL